jgi:hypothetical protein
MKRFGERMCGAGDDRGIKSKEKAAQGGDDRAFKQV